MLLFQCVAVLLAMGALLTSGLKEVEEMKGSCGATVDFLSHPAERAASIVHTAKYVQQLPDKSKEAQKEFTVEEVKEYDGTNGKPTYLIMDNNVYDFQELIQYHPAGPEPIREHAGRDVTTIMKTSGMPPAAYQPLLHYFRVGYIISSEKDNSTAVQSMASSIGSRF